uniref:Neurexin n=1 Tax=Timema cristinae TaxID=61476 RepID=A0A7R9CHX6_TIMCR|nr:unnamed protein product [Timema cristinae]
MSVVVVGRVCRGGVNRVRSRANSSRCPCSWADFFAFELLNGHIYLHLDLGSGGVKVTSTTRRVDDGLWHEVTLRRAGKEGRVTADGTASDFSSPGDSNQLDLEGPLYIGGVGPPTATLAVPPVLWAGVLRYGYVGCMRDLVINGNAIDIAGYARQQDYGYNLDHESGLRGQPDWASERLKYKIEHIGCNERWPDWSELDAAQSSLQALGNIIKTLAVIHQRIRPSDKSVQTRRPPHLVMYGKNRTSRGVVVVKTLAAIHQRIRPSDKSVQTRRPPHLVMYGAIRPSCPELPSQCDSQPCMNGGVCSEGWNRFICDCTATSFTGPTCGKDATTLTFNGSQHMLISVPEESRTQTEDVTLRFRTTRPLGLLLTTSTEQSADRLELAVAGGRVRLTIRLGDKEKGCKLRHTTVNDQSREFGTTSQIHGHHPYSSPITFSREGSRFNAGLKHRMDQVMVAGQGLNDNQWHTLQFSRRGSGLKLQVDDDTPARGDIWSLFRKCLMEIHLSQQWMGQAFFDDLETPLFAADSVLGKQNILEFRTMHVGGLYHVEEEIQMTNTVPNFVGSMQQFSFNGHPYFEMARSSGGGYGGQQTSGSAAQLRVTAKFGKKEHQLVHHPVTFRSKHTFVGLPVLKAYSATNIYFQFKTREPNGLLLYNAGREQDFLAVELVNGHLHYIFNLGDGPVRVRDNARNSLNDNKWHAVTIGRPSPKQHTLMVDDNFAIVTSLGTNENLDLAGILYLGGVRKDMYTTLPKQIQSRHGYEGCLASLDLNGESPNIMVDAVVPSSQLTAGCEGPSTKCSHNVCANRGVCVQQWNAYACDCDMTSYTGPTCSDESISYEFGPGRGLVTYVYPEDRRPEMKSDVIALGFVTTKEDAVLMRIDSGTSNDYMELEIVEGNIFMVYNMGTNDHPIGEIGIKVNDNTFHVVRFTRSGANSTIQVDDYNVQTNHPAGHQLTVFNSQAQVQVGGKWSRAKQRVERPFSGVMSGAVFNGLRLLDLASEKDPRTAVRGDVRLMSGLGDRQFEPLQRMQQTPPSGYPGVMDDLVFSGAGSGCNADDEDECTPVFESGSGDDLITPVYVPPTRAPTAPSRTHKPGVSGGDSKPCDDEEEDDCGSGSGEVTTENHGTTAAKEPVTGGSTPVVGTGGSTDPSSSTSEVPTGTLPDGSSSSSIGSTGGSSEQPNGSTGSEPTTRPSYPLPSIPPKEPPLPPPPPQPIPSRPPTRPKPRDRISSEAAENTALIIGIIAGALIAIILIILIILKFKNTLGGVVQEVKEGFGNQINLCRDRGLNLGPPAQKCDTLPIDHQVT